MRLPRCQFFLLAIAMPCHAASLCAPNESVVFSCAARAKIVSICSSGGTSTRYRFGTTKRVELSHPDQNASIDTTFGGSYSYGPGFSSYVTFERGSFRYYTYSNYGDDVLSETGTKMANAFEEAGVVVFEGEHPIRHIKCTKVAVRLSEASFKKYGFVIEDGEAFYEAWRASDGFIR